MSTIPSLEHRVLDVQQGTLEWFEARLACVTSSRIADVIAKRKRVKAGEPAEEMAKRYDYRMEKALEMLTGKVPAHYVSDYMIQGLEKEPLARTEYEQATGVDVQLVGLVYHPTIKRGAASPDGLLGTDGLIEIKCPMPTTHLQYVIDDVVPEQYKPQMLWQMACTERKWCDFVSYHPDFPDPYHLFIKRFERDDALIAAYELEVNFFNQQVDETLAMLKERRNK